MATHANILSWRIPQTEKTGGLQSKVSQTVRHECVTMASLVAQLVKNLPAMQETRYWLHTHACPTPADDVYIHPGILACIWPSPCWSLCSHTPSHPLHAPCPTVCHVS